MRFADLGRGRNGCRSRRRRAPARRSARRNRPAPAESGARGTAARGRWRRACPRRCRAKRCLRSRRRIPGCAEWRSGPGISARRRPCSPLPQASRKLMGALARMLRRGEQIAAELADILHQRAVPAVTSSQKSAGGELVADHDRAAAHQQRADRRPRRRRCDRAAGSHTGGRRGRYASGRRTRSSTATPAVADIGGLRQAGGAGGVDQQRAVGERHRAALGRDQRRRRDSARPRDRCGRMACRRRAPRASGGFAARVLPISAAQNSAAAMTCSGADRHRCNGRARARAVGC